MNCHHVVLHPSGPALADRFFARGADVTESCSTSQSAKDSPSLPFSPAGRPSHHVRRSKAKALDPVPAQPAVLFGAPVSGQFENGSVLVGSIASTQGAIGRRKARPGVCRAAATDVATEEPANENKSTQRRR